MKAIEQLHKQLKRNWDQYRVHRDWICDGDLFPIHLSLGKITDKQLLHDYDAVRRWVAEVEKRFSKHSGIDIEYQDVQFKTMGWQRLPVGLCIPTADGLAFPPLKNSLVIFGFGYGIQMLRSVKWLSACQIHYWGDIDTHGFKILSQIRHYFPNTRSFLMDETTLLLSKDFWGVESTPAADNELAHLTPEEQSLYQGLKQNRWAVNLRLEQERIPFEHVQDSLKRFR